MKNKNQKIKKLSSDGLAHFVLPLVIIIGVAVAGTFYLVASHADPLTATSKTKTSQKPITEEDKRTAEKITSELGPIITSDAPSTTPVASASNTYNPNETKYTQKFEALDIKECESGMLTPGKGAHWDCGVVIKKVKKSKKDLVVYTARKNQIGSCNGVVVGNLPVNLGPTRKVTCKFPKNIVYILHLREMAHFQYQKPNKPYTSRAWPVAALTRGEDGYIFNWQSRYDPSNKNAKNGWVSETQHWSSGSKKITLGSAFRK